MWWIQKNKKPEHGVQYNRSKVIKINMIITMMIFILMYSMLYLLHANTVAQCINSCLQMFSLSLRQWGSNRSALINVPYRSVIKVKYKSIIEVPL